MSTIRADDVGPSAGGTTRALVRGTAAAWVNFNGTGTIAARDSENVSSLTDNGTGDYTVNFSNAFNSASYAISGAVTGGALGSSAVAATFASPHGTAPTVSALRSLTYSSSSLVFYDTAQLTLSIHGDLA